VLPVSSQQRIKPAFIVELVKVIAAANVFSLDEDLGSRLTSISV
jgi:hypothetical protein